jgi:hypothetical protein
MTRLVLLLVAAILGVTLCLPRAAGAYERAYAPWELVSSGINGALKSLGYVPMQSTATNGGAWRSWTAA